MNTIYIDTNRQNSSVKSSDTNSEWEYKLSNTIQLPAGTEIGIQDVFLHKQGISGATIEIEEDITETLFFSVYLSDNPHWVPKPSFEYDNRPNTACTDNTAYTPSFMPFGILNNRAAFNPTATVDAGDNIFGNEYDITRIQASNGTKHNGGKYYGQPNAAQRIAMFENDGGTLGGLTYGENPRLQGGEFHNLNDPYITGYSEYPMMAIYVARGQDPTQALVNDTAGATETYTTEDNDLTFGDAIGLHDKIPDNLNSTRLPDYRFKPYVKSVDILIKKGVYSIAEIADLIENQINGKYTNLKNDDYYTDTIINKQNSQTFRGTLETNGIYTKARALDRFALRESGTKGEDRDGSIDVDFSAGPVDGEDASTNYQKPNDNLYAVYSQDSYFNPAQTTNGHPTYGPPDEPAEMFPNYNPSGLNGLHYVGFNDAYGLPWYPLQLLSNITYYSNATTQEFKTVPNAMLAYNEFPAGGTTQALDPAFPERTCIQSKLKGRRPALPTTEELLYIPVHYYNQLVKMWIHDDYQDRNSGKEAGANAYLFESDGNWTVNTRRLFRYGFQSRVNCYGRSTAPPNGLDMSNNDNQIGLHYVGKSNGKPDIIQHPKKDSHNNLYPVNQEQKVHIGVSPAQYQYDIFKDGYYVGTPDFSFSYDSDKSAFAIQGLHQSKRIPSADMRGNPMTSEGQECVYVRRQATGLEDFMIEPRRTEAIIQNIIDTTGTTDRNQWSPAQRAYEERFNKGNGAAGFREKIRSVLSNNEDRVGGVAIYNWAYHTAKKYGDIDPKTFTKISDSGHPYKVYHDDFEYLWKFQDFFSSEDKAKKAWNNTLWARLGFTYDNLQSEKSWEKVPYYDLPVDKYTNEPSAEALATGNSETIRLSRRANTYYEPRNKMYFKNEDFVLYGKTTKGDIGLDSGPTISTTFNNLLFQYTEKPVSGKVNPDEKKAGLISQVIRTYDNTNPVKPYYGYDYEIITEGLDGGQANSNLTDYASVSLEQNPLTGSAKNAFADVFDMEFSYDNSMYQGKTRVPVLSSSKSIIATKLPHLSDQGYFIITSDIVDNSQDELKQGQPLPLLSVVPISNLSNQDFITSDSDIVHTLNQTKNLNSVKIKVLNPNLTPAELDENSSVILKINMPMPQNSPLTMGVSQQVKSGNVEKNKNKHKEQEDPRDDNTQSGR